MSELHAIQRLIAHLEKHQPRDVPVALVTAARDELSDHRQLSRLLKRLNRKREVR